MYLITMTIDSLQDARSMSFDVIEKELAVSAHMHEIDTLHHWNGVVNNKQEYQVEFVTDKRDEIVDYLEKNHPYEIPEILIYEPDSAVVFSTWLKRKSGGKIQK